MSHTFLPKSLDHVALWVAENERAPLAGFVCDHLGMHVIEETDTFTLVGVDAKLGKLTLFDAEGPRERGALERVVLRVADVEVAASRVPVPVELVDGEARFDAPGGLAMGLVGAEGRDYDLDHVVLRLPEVGKAAAVLAEMGFEPRGDAALAVADRELRLVEGEAGEVERPLLNHLALLVDSAHDVQAEAERQGFEVDDVKDAPNTFAVFLRGPAGVRVEYVEHKPGFALV
jgi:catechol 2,3-dioxygenase-like lactoylglutathione lyase family enzyme